MEMGKVKIGGIGILLLTIQILKNDAYDKYMYDNYYTVWYRG
jgi:hypothetical protein